MNVLYMCVYECVIQVRIVMCYTAVCMCPAGGVTNSNTHIGNAV